MQFDASSWATVSEIFDRVADLPAAERDRVLATLPYATQRSVQDLLNACANQRAFEADIGAVRRDLASDWLREQATEHGVSVGDVLGPWRIVREIGRGGMGTVYLAERADGHFDKHVAIKLLSYPTDALFQRFRLERQILARLEHPNIAGLIDAGLSDNGIPYFVMDYIEGVSITKYCTAHKSSLADRLGFVIRICEAVQFAHKNLIVHRDLKPSNIFITTDGVPNLLDFGVAKWLDQDESRDSSNTAVHFLTPDYAAPEQLRGDVVTTATDVYALGVVCYELLTGARPRQVAREWNRADTAFEADVVAPSIASGIFGNPMVSRRDLRGDLDRIVLRALAREPDERYPSAQMLADDVANYLAGRPVNAVHGGWSYRARKLVRRHPVSTLGVLLAVAALGTGVAGIT